MNECWENGKLERMVAEEIEDVTMVESVEMMEAMERTCILGPNPCNPGF